MGMTREVHPDEKAAEMIKMDTQDAFIQVDKTGHGVSSATNQWGIAFANYGIYAGCASFEVSVLSVGELTHQQGWASGLVRVGLGSESCSILGHDKNSIAYCSNGKQL